MFRPPNKMDSLAFWLFQGSTGSQRSVLILGNNNKQIDQVVVLLDNLFVLIFQWGVGGGGGFSQFPSKTTRKWAPSRKDMHTDQDVTVLD